MTKTTIVITAVITETGTIKGDTMVTTATDRKEMIKGSKAAIRKGEIKSFKEYFFHLTKTKW